MFSGSVMTSVIFTIIISGAAIIIPLLMIYFATRKTETGTGILGSFGLGLLAYFWSQYLLTLPIILILNAISGFEKLSASKNYYFVYLIITAVVLVGLASLGRLWCVWLMNKRTPSLYRAISSAVGFAAFTAVSRIATYSSYYSYMKLCNTEGEDALKSLIMANGTITDESATVMIDSLKSASSMGIALEGVNVLFMLMVEIGLIAIIYQGFVCRKTVKATLISAGIGLVYSFVGMLINALGTDKMGNVISVETTLIVYNVYQFTCALAGAWIAANALRKYKKAMSEGAYVQSAYFEK